MEPSKGFFGKATKKQEKVRMKTSDGSGSGWSWLVVVGLRH